MTNLRRYSFLDKLCLGLDQGIKALTDGLKTSDNPYPACDIPEGELSDQEKKHIAGLMRVNHAGEICAQALYAGQAFASRQNYIQAKMQQAALEESDHLHWCKLRLDELGSHTSYLNPFWYLGSFTIGMAAGLIGDQWSLGFVAETETQVVNHLQSHLQQLPKQDQRTYHILQQMQKDESSHRNDAILSGAKELPGFVKKAMSLMSKIMVKTSYWV